jgi:two-component system, NtrC family, nitrogen regulation sensor histidine kinase NtrY
MKLTIQIKFIFFIALIHIIALAMSFYIFEKNKVFFLFSEFFILVSLAICASLYADIIQPLQLLMRGIEALKDKDFTVKFVETGRYEMDKLITVYNTMIDQLRTERTIQQEQHFFLEKLIQTSPTGIIILDFDNKIKALNSKALDIIGINEKNLIEQPLENFNHILLKTALNLKKGVAITVNTEGVKKYKIQKAQFIDRGFPRDFITLEELTSEILLAEKQAYGKVIRMMAHEVNNSIGAVNSILDTCHKMEQDPEVAQALALSIERNNHLNHFMRNFADVIRLPEPYKEVCDITSLLKNVLLLMDSKAKEKGIDMRLSPPTLPLSIKADIGQMEQVFINIIKNAIEAISEKNGKIDINIYGDSKHIDIIDNGMGISPAIESQLFSPFFTNKNGGQGIGLTLIREILTNHGFEFSLKTKHYTEGVRTVFKIQF